MSATQQYRPVSTAEVAVDAPLTVRMIRDFASAIQNYISYVGNHKLITQICIPHWASHLGTTEERVIHCWAPRFVPTGYKYLTLFAGHYRAAGSGTTTWRIYSTYWFYRGPIAMDTAELIPGYSVTYWDTDSGTHAIHKSEHTLRIRKGFNIFNHFILTAENSDNTTQSKLTTIDVWPAPIGWP